MNVKRSVGAVVARPPELIILTHTHTQSPYLINKRSRTRYGKEHAKQLDAQSLGWLYSDGTDLDEYASGRWKIEEHLLDFRVTVS